MCNFQAKDEELLALKEGCQEYDPNYNPKFIFIIATKRHNKRFFTIGPNGRAENLEPGSVIYAGPVRQDVTEFFMQSHFPFQVCVCWINNNKNSVPTYQQRGSSNRTHKICEFRDNAYNSYGVCPCICNRKQQHDFCDFMFSRHSKMKYSRFFRAPQNRLNMVFWLTNSR